jgi:hypothetical protein
MREKGREAAARRFRMVAENEAWFGDRFSVTLVQK